MRDDEQVLSWRTVWNDLYQEEGDRFDPHDDRAASEMHRLRGLVMAQAAETEAVVGHILQLLDPDAKLARPAGALLAHVRRELHARGITDYTESLNVIADAIDKRNHAVHEAVVIGSAFMPYATGFGGNWEPVVSMMGDDLYDESDLRNDLTAQLAATRLAVRVYHDLNLDGRAHAPAPPRPGARGRKKSARRTRGNRG